MNILLSQENRANINCLLLSSHILIFQKRYVTISSGEVVLKVEKDVGGGAQIQGLPASVNKQAVRSLNEDIRYIVTGNSGLSRGNQFLDLFGTF